MDAKNICEYFKENKDNDSRIFFLWENSVSFMYCANENCPYRNHVGKTFVYEGVGIPVCECATRGFKTDETSELVEKVISESASSATLQPS